MVTVWDLRDYLNCSPDTTTASLQMWLDAAKSEARSAGIPDFKHNAQYDLFICSLVGWYYDNRGLQVSGSYQATQRETMQKMKDAFVLQLRHATEDPEEESSEDSSSDPSGEDDPQEGGDGA